MTLGTALLTLMFLSGMGIFVTLPAMFTNGYVRLNTKHKKRTESKLQGTTSDTSNPVVTERWFDEVCAACEKYEKIYKLKSGVLLQKICASHAEIIEIKDRAARDLAISGVAKIMAENSAEDSESIE
jgi:hypothetical protein